jgi:hypothetical protein
VLVPSAGVTAQARQRRTLALVLSGALVAALGFVDAVLLAFPIRQLPLRVVGMFNEGWNAFAAERALGPGPLYPEASSLLANNYPPLSFFLVGGVGRLVGDQVVAGRAVALVSLAVVAWAVQALVRRATGSRLLGAVGALLLLAVMMVDYRAYVGMNDPQWLGHAFMSVGLLVLSVERRNRGRLLAAMLLVLAGGLVKHSLVPLPLAITLWLLWHDRRAATAWLGLCLVGLGAALVWIQLAFGPDAFVGIVEAPRRIQAAHAGAKLAAWLPPLLPLVAGTGALVALAPRDPVARLLVLYVGLALAWAALTLGGAGVSYNALFDVLIGGTAASMLAVEQLAERVGRRRLGPPLVRALALLPLCIPVLLRASPEIRDTPTRIALLPLRVARVEADREFLAAQVGPALCEQPALCYWAGKDYEVDAFHTVEKLASGALPLRQLDELLEEQRFAVLHVSKPASPIYRRALRSYEVVRERAGFVFMIPRAPASSETGPAAGGP